MLRFFKGNKLGKQPEKEYLWTLKGWPISSSLPHFPIFVYKQTDRQTNSVFQFILKHKRGQQIYVGSVATNHLVSNLCDTLARACLFFKKMIFNGHNWKQYFYLHTLPFISLMKMLSTLSVHVVLQNSILYTDLVLVGKWYCWSISFPSGLNVLVSIPPQPWARLWNSSTHFRIK